MTQEFQCDCGKRLNIPGAIGAAGMLKRSGWVMGKDGVWSCSTKCLPILPELSDKDEAADGWTTTRGSTEAFRAYGGHDPTHADEAMSPLDVALDAHLDKVLAECFPEPRHDQESDVGHLIKRMFVTKLAREAFAAGWAAAVTKGES